MRRVLTRTLKTLCSDLCPRAFGAGAFFIASLEQGLHRCLNERRWKTGDKILSQIAYQKTSIAGNREISYRRKPIMFKNTPPRVVFATKRASRSLS